MRISPLRIFHIVALLAATLALLGLVPPLAAVQLTMPFVLWFAVLVDVLPAVYNRRRQRQRGRAE